MTMTPSQLRCAPDMLNCVWECIDFHPGMHALAKRPHAALGGYNYRRLPARVTQKLLLLLLLLLQSHPGLLVPSHLLASGIAL